MTKILQVNHLNFSCKLYLQFLFFLYTDKIVKTAHVTDKTPLVVEVGPGPGLLSRSILDAGANKVIAVEKDDRFIPTLHVMSIQ